MLEPAESKGRFVVHAYRSMVEEKLASPEFQAKLAELLKPNVPTRLATEMFRKLLYLENENG